LENPTGLVEGLVSGSKNQRINTDRRAAAAMLRNTTVRPKLTTMPPNSTVLNEGPIPDAIPTRPCARLNGAVRHVGNHTSMVITPTTVSLIPPSN
jgi:hypothetical protein